MDNINKLKNYLKTTLLDSFLESLFLNNIDSDTFFKILDEVVAELKKKVN